MTPATISVTTSLDERERAQVTGLLDKVTASDGVSPLSEQSRLSLRAKTGVLHLLASEAGALAGYAQYDPAACSGELMVDPDLRRRGIGTALLVHMRGKAGELGAGLCQGPCEDNGPKVWAHGDLAPAQALAGRLGMIKVRELWRLLRPLGEPFPAPSVPDGLSLSTFLPGRDEQDWLAANRAAFASHPEQGTWGMGELRARMDEDWFDPSAFFLLRDGAGIAAFTWLKCDNDDGEIYVLAVNPSRQAKGLGRYLVRLSLAELTRRGLATASLYVDASNLPAMALYRDAGFEAVSADGQYAYPA